MEKIDSQTLTEVYEIIQNSNQEVRNKIPYRFKKYVYKNMDRNYKANIKPEETLLQQNINEKTKDILALIYRDYLVDEEERQKLIKEEIGIVQKIEEEKLEKYNPNNLFKQKDDNLKKEANLIIYKEEKFWKKIINYIKNKLNRKEVK